MAIYFVQHGIAVDKTVDLERPLSERGREGVNNMAGHLSDKGIQVTGIYHSGKTRAEQTAEIFADAFKPTIVEVHEHLNPNDDVEQLIPHLQDDCLYVGHLPHLQKMVARLLCGDPEKPVISFENAAVVCISQNGPDYSLEWFLKPSML